MKNTRKIISLMLVVMLLLLSSISSFASTPTGSIAKNRGDIVLDIIHEMERAGTAKILENDYSNNQEYFKIKYEGDRVEEVTRYMDADGQSCYTITAGDTTNNLIINEDTMTLDGFEVKRSPSPITPYGVGTYAWAFSSSPWGSSSDYTGNSTTYNVNVPLGQAIIGVTLTAAFTFIGNWYGAVGAIYSISSSAYSILQASNADASSLFWKEVRKENLVLAGIYTQYFKFNRSFYVNSACTKPLYDKYGAQVKDTTYAMKSTNY